MGGINRTEKLEDGIGAEKDTFLHTGRIQFLDQIGKNGDNQSIVHAVKEDCDKGHHDDRVSTGLRIHLSLN